MTMQTIMTRRSIRRFTSEPVPDEAVQQLLEAAMAAPSAGNEQPWHFVVIRDRKLLDQIPSVHPYSQMVKQASVAILICADKTLSKYEVDYWIQDCAAATQNILLEANDQGLGTVWLGVYPMADRIEGMKRLFSLPEQIIPFAIIPVGHPDETKDPINRYQQERVHQDKW